MISTLMGEKGGKRERERRGRQKGTHQQGVRKNVRLAAGPSLAESGLS